MTFFEKLGEDLANSLTAEDVIPVKGWSPWWKDYFGSSTAFNRAGRARTVARALGEDKAHYSLEHPLLSSAIFNRGGTLLGGLAGWGLGGSMAKSNPAFGKYVGSLVGSTVGEVIGGGLIGYLRRKQLIKLNDKLQKALTDKNKLNLEAPPSGLANYIPYVGAGRLGATEAYLQLKHRDKELGKDDLVIPEEIAHNILPGPASMMLRTMQGHKAKKLLEQDKAKPGESDDK